MKKIETEKYIYYFNHDLPTYNINYEPGDKTVDDILMSLITKYSGTIQYKGKKVRKNEDV